MNAIRPEYHVIIDRDDDGEPVYNLTKPNRILDAIVAQGLMVHWSFASYPTPQESYDVHVYHHRPEMPAGENLAEMNRRAVLCVLNNAGG